MTLHHTDLNALNALRSSRPDIGLRLDLLNLHAANKRADGVFSVKEQAEVDQLAAALRTDWPLIRRAMLIDIAMLNPAIALVAQAVKEDWDGAVLREWLTPGVGSRDAVT